MEQLKTLLEEILNIDVILMMISGVRDKSAATKIKIRPVMLKGDLKFQATSYVGTKVLHTNYDGQQLREQILLWMDGSYRQLQISTRTEDVTVLVSKKGKVTIQRKRKKETSANAAAPFEMVASHNREKKYILKEGEPVGFLVDLGVMTKDGKIVRSRYDKFRQINRFLEFIEDILPSLPKGRRIHIIDFGCGKSYLTFAMYHYLKNVRGFDIEITGLDLKKDVIEHCSKLAVQYGYEHLHFLHGDIASYEDCDSVDMVVTLHACDTATDYALYKAVLWNAKVILSVPCCQHELNKQLRCDDMNAVLQYGLLKERMAALLTDGMRAELLNGAGYKTQVLEFIDMEHTPKNILLRCVKEPDRRSFALTEKYKKCRDLFGASLTLEKLLTEHFLQNDAENKGFLSADFVQTASESKGGCA